VVADTLFGTRTHGLRARLARHVQLREVEFAAVLTGEAVALEAVCVAVVEFALFPACVLVCPSFAEQFCPRSCWFQVNCYI
jgi:hypothetical protein